MTEEVDFLALSLFHGPRKMKLASMARLISGLYSMLSVCSVYSIGTRRVVV